MGIPYVSIHPSQLTAFSLQENPGNYNRVQIHKAADVRKAALGLLSNKSRQRLQLAIKTLLFVAEWKTVYQKESDKTFRFKVNFITLTLPAPTTLTDRQVVSKVLGNFLRKWHKRSPKLLYVWKAETQDSGRLHFHLTTNRFIHYEKLRAIWNKECQKHGIEHSELGLNANSTDVHSVKNIRNLAAYICSYVSKKDLYKRPLKRWFRRYHRQLADMRREVVPLPRNYFKMLKRRPDCALWGASKPLLASKVSALIEGTPAGEDFHNFVAINLPTFQDDYIAFWSLEKDQLKAMPNLHALWRTHFNSRLKEDNTNDKAYYVV